MRAFALCFLLAAAPASAQSLFLDAVQAAAAVTANLASTTGEAATQTQQTVGQAQQTVQAAQPATAPAPASSTMSNVQPVTVPVNATNCSPAPTPEIFRYCLQLSQHHDGSWQARNPTVGQPKTGNNGPGFGVPPSRILPTPSRLKAQ